MPFSHSPHGPMPAAAFSAIFVAALALTLGARLWLARRQITHVVTHRDAVPAAFASRIGIAAHQKAADYTVAKQRLGMLETVVDAAFLLLLTLGGGLALMFALTERANVSPLWRDVLLLAGVAVAGGIVSVPFSWWQTFRIE